ncbi:MAG: DUF1622 domain-containing protein [Anaerorhabdus sp.]
MYDYLHEILVVIVNYSIVIFELIGILIILVAGLVGFVNYVKKDPLTRLKLAKGMAMGLEFKIGSEILRTVIVRDLSEIAIVGSIILLRAALTFLIHWEISREEAEHAKSIDELKIKDN